MGNNTKVIKSVKLYPQGMDLTTKLFGTELQALEAGYLFLWQRPWTEVIQDNGLFDEEPKRFLPNWSYYPEYHKKITGEGVMAKFIARFRSR